MEIATVSIFYYLSLSLQLFASGEMIQDSNRSFPLTKHSLFVITSSGEFLLPIRDTIISKSMITYGEWEESELILFSKIIRPDDCLIEVGANIGTHTVPLAKMLSGGGYLFAFEMVRTTFQYLSANLAINGIQNVFAYNNGLSNASKTIQLGTADFLVDSNIGSASLWELDMDILNRRISSIATKPDSAKLILSTPLQIITLDEFFLLNKQSACPRLLKTDAEGFDELILQGSSDLIARCKPILYIENKCIALSKSLIRYIQSRNYTQYWHVPPEIRPNNRFNTTLDRQSVAHAVNVLAYPIGYSNDMVLDEYCIRIEAERGLYYLHEYNLTMVYNVVPPMEMALRQDGDERTCLTFTPE